MARSFAELELEAENVQTLDELFKLWKDTHEVEPDCIKTFPRLKKNIFPEESSFKRSFKTDGVSCELGCTAGLRDKTAEILFVLKESNILDENCSVSNDFDFWFNQAVEGNSAKKKAITVRNNYMKWFSTFMDKYCSDWDSQTPIGYMNLNKRGGFSKTNYNQLKAYVRKYHRFILKEIEIIAPKVIVLCGCVGEFVLGLMEANALRIDHAPNGDYQILCVSDSVTPRIITTHHPSARL